MRINNIHVNRRDHDLLICKCPKRLCKEGRLYFYNELFALIIMKLINLFVNRTFFCLGFESTVLSPEYSRNFPFLLELVHSEVVNYTGA